MVRISGLFVPSADIEGRCEMFKFIGATVVYGFAIYGLATWLMRSGKDGEVQASAQLN